MQCLRSFFTTSPRAVLVSAPQFMTTPPAVARAPFMRARREMCVAGVQPGFMSCSTRKQKNGREKAHKAQKKALKERVSYASFLRFLFVLLVLFRGHFYLVVESELTARNQRPHGVARGLAGLQIVAELCRFRRGRLAVQGLEEQALDAGFHRLAR